MSALRVGFVPGILLFGLVLHGYAIAGNWQRIIVGKNEIIEIDTASIANDDSNPTAWSRVTLDRPARDAGGAFDSIHAQNLYDCTGRRFTTLRRAYFNGGTLVREDLVSRRRANPIQVGSVDERLFNLACRVTATRDAPVSDQIAGRATAGASNGDLGGRPAPMRADLRVPMGEQATPRLMPVADSTPVAPPEKPKLIILPPIDKAAADKAAGSSGQKPTSTPPSAPAPATTVKVTPASPDKSLTPKLPATKSAGDRQETESQADKRLRELHYATSGPRKVTKKKQPEAAAAASGPEHPASQLHGHWSYEGEGGPHQWAALRGDYATCGTGKRQSPIDIREGIKVNLEAIKFDYKPTQVRIVDTGHTLQVSVGEGLGLTVMGKRHELIQFHFHRPSEERINGRSYDMVAHLVHRNAEGQLAVVAVLLEKGSEHPLIQTVWNNLPLEQNMEVTPEESIDLNKLLPENRSYWTYMGSLTTPPCTEGVLWMVLKQPMQVAAEQVAIFSRVYRNNARPLQPANGRLIKESR
jgi:carbonic anhydrase